ncbi:MAG: ester cyclase, partial [Dehalococcoidia bacterium]
ILIHVALPLVPPETRGWEAGKRNLAAIVTALPDATLTLDEVITAEDRFALRVTFEGSHSGDVLGVIPTGKAVSITGIYLAHVEDGKIVEAWLLYTAPPWVQLIGAQDPAAGAIAANEELARRIFAALNARDLDALQEVISDEVVVHTRLPGPLAITEPGLAAAAASLLGIVTALPDVQLTLDEVIASNDRFAVRGTLTGTHTGEFGGIAATGKPLTLTGLHHAHVADEKVVEVWSMYSGPAWVDELAPAAAAAGVDVARATPIAAGTLDDLLALPGVIAALEFAADGTLGEYRSKIDVPVTEFEQTAGLIATANTFLPALLTRYNELSSLEWDTPRWLVYSSDAWTAALAGNRAVLAETAAVDFNQLYGALAGAR